MMSSDGSSEVRFSSSGSLKNAFPEWSPDGKAILFTQMEEEIGIPWLVAAAVGGEDTRGVRLYPELSFPLREGSYSPDGLWVVFEGWTEPENKEIYAMFSTGSGLRPLTDSPGNDFDAVWRPFVNNH
jgi:Tol biopolymer transport system component